MAKAKVHVTHHLIDDVKFNMIHCPAGEFWMGSEDGVGFDSERPRHLVKMTKGFWIGETQVTQELWTKVMGWNPSCFKGNGKLPVETVTWYDCLVFCNKLSESKGFTPCFTLSNIKQDGNQITKANVEWNRNANGYRLPTEAEWEYCAKAGTELTYSGSNNFDEVAWYSGNSKVNGTYTTTHEVKTKKANGWGLYDMSGNVWEWCMDKYDSSTYQSRNNGIENLILWEKSPVRGGSFRGGADGCRVAYRNRVGAGYWYNYLGFRLLRCEP
jgi:formylglycine-generating enzyme required for sulfatase activity